MKRHSQETTILIADDHPMFRQGLRHVIEKEEGLRIIGEARDGAEAIDLIERMRPTVAVLDLDMPKMNGLDVTSQVTERRIRVSILILTMYNEEEMFNKAVSLGVKGYILKDSAVLDIVHGIIAVARGEYFFSPSMSNLLMKHDSEVDTQRHRSGLDQLTPTERKVLFLIAENKVTAEIAEEMFISPRTVEHHRSHICEKLHVSGSYALVRFALQNKHLLSESGEGRQLS